MALRRRIVSWRGSRVDLHSWQELSVGAGPYAPTTFVDAEGQPCLVFWIRDVIDPHGVWSGAMSLPYRLSTHDGRLILTPHPNIVRHVARTDSATALTWLPRPEDELVLGRPGKTAATLSHRDGRLTVRAGLRDIGIDLTAPRVPIDVIVDGPVLEVCTGTTVAALQVAEGPIEVAQSSNVRSWVDARGRLPGR